MYLTTSTAPHRSAYKPVKPATWTRNSRSDLRVKDRRRDPDATMYDVAEITWLGRYYFSHWPSILFHLRTDYVLFSEFPWTVPRSFSVLSEAGGLHFYCFQYIVHRVSLSLTFLWLVDFIDWCFSGGTLNQISSGRVQYVVSLVDYSEHLIMYGILIRDAPLTK